MNIKDIKDLLKLVNDSDLTEVSIENEGFKLIVKKGSGVMAQMPVYQVAPAAPVVHQATSQPSVPVTEVTAEVTPNVGELLITSPMVGTFYRSPAPGALPFIEEGSVVKQGQPVCIIEAMKLMNEIESEHSGRVIKVLVEDAQPVEYGQPLFVLEKV